MTNKSRSSISPISRQEVRRGVGEEGAEGASEEGGKDGGQEADEEVEEGEFGERKPKVGRTPKAPTKAEI